ncbi:hypothetical protein NC653_005730 [Populus alba x Populus x berolinensis]|uniref:Uncharacterized protein n=1 Tax=Populus alba x Populus x berolinensis TaxID=444605 RepID=A0AAD6RCM0_9ROSI|nr:hypothetical protein NC653_005730 [Populus alba x Populus x berolinensis]
MKVHVAERELRGEPIPDRPPYRGGGNRSYGRTQEVQGGKVSFRDKVIGPRSPPCPREKMDMLWQELVRIEYENGNRLLPKVFPDDFNKLCYPWGDYSLINR